MTSVEIQQVTELLGLGPKELAYLLGVSVKTLRRGTRDGSTADSLLRGCAERLQDPEMAPSVRALMITSARGGGLKALVMRLTRAYVTLDLLRV